MKLFHYLNVKQIFLIIFLVIAAKFDLFGQQTFVDDPNLDQVPEWYLEQFQKSPKQIAQVITINDYDNFFLGVDNAEGHISVSPLNPTQFFTVFNTDNAHYSMDGFVWENTQPNWGVTIRGDVVSAYDSLGNLFYENMYGSSILGCKVVRSTNNGQTWSSPVTAISGNDKNWIAADQTSGPYANYIYTTMTNNGVGNFARSTDHGATWTSTFQPTTQSLPGMMVCVGPYQNIQGGAVYVVTNSGDAFASTYTFYRSLNGGVTFQQMSSQNFAGYVGTNINGRHSVENMRTRPYPFIAADNSYGAYRGRLYLVYAANFPAGNGNKPDIWCRYSTNGGTTWSSAIRVNDDVNPELYHQFEPAIWCDKNTGRLYIQWMDTRDTPANDKALIYATYSDNGGQSFAVNKAISNEKMTINCTTCGGSGTPRYQGDYNGIVSNSKVSMATWADFRYGTFASFTSFFPDYAMRVTPLSQQISTSGTFYAEVPDVKLYSDAVTFTATVSNPPSGSFSISYPNGNSLSSFPGSVPVVVTANNVPAGSYTLTISGKGINGTPVHYREATINVIAAQPPVANFSASTTNPFIGQTVNFTDLSTNNPISWVWSFSPATVTYVGGTTSSSQNPQVQFLSGGFYTVILTVTNSGGSDGETKTNYISVLFAPIANFSANNTNPFIGQTVSFTDLSVNNPVSWTWSFNPATINYIGGTSASSQNPQVQFTAGGFYTVSLIASNPSGSDSEIKMNYISTIFAPIADFDADNYSPSITQTVNFWDLSLNNPTSWSWSFDPNTISYVGGTNSFSQEPQVQFLAGGVYTVTLTSANASGSDSETKNDFISVLPPPVADFIASTIVPFTGEIVIFSDLSSNYPYLWSWTFNPSTVTFVGGTNFTSQNPQVIFNFSGLYSVTLTATNASGGDAETKTDYINAQAPVLDLDLTVFLEGPFNGTTMKTDLTGLTDFPLNQPYNTAPWNYSGAESVVSLPALVVDWVLVELRDATSAASATSSTRIGRKAAFIRNDGRIIGLNGNPVLDFGALTIANSLFVVIHHRNHISVISASGLTQSEGVYTYNFSTGSGQVYGGTAAHKQIGSIWGMFGGNGDGNGVVNALDEDPVWQTESGAKGYLRSDYNFDTESNNNDKNDIWAPNQGAGNQVPN